MNIGDVAKLVECIRLANELTAERDQLRAEVERLTKERDEARLQVKHDSNACADELCWARNLGDGDPSPSLAVSEVLAQLRRTRLERNEAWARVDADARHAEKVLVDVAKQAARLGAEDMRRRALAAVSSIRAVWKNYRDNPIHGGEERWTERWDAAYNLSSDVETQIKGLCSVGDEP